MKNTKLLFLDSCLHQKRKFTLCPRTIFQEKTEFYEVKNQTPEIKKFGERSDKIVDFKDNIDKNLQELVGDNEVLAKDLQLGIGKDLDNAGVELKGRYKTEYDNLDPKLQDTVKKHDLLARQYWEELKELGCNKISMTKEGIQMFKDNEVMSKKFDNVPIHFTSAH